MHEMINYLYGVMLSQMILSHSDNLSRTLQKRNLSAAEGQDVAGIVVQTLQRMHTDGCFHLFGKGRLSRQKTCTSLKHSCYGEGKCQDVSQLKMLSQSTLPHPMIISRESTMKHLI